MMTLEEVEQEALGLPVDERALLAKRLLLSLEEVSETEFDSLWGQESARRAKQFDAGEIQAVSGNNVTVKARDLLL